jgi:5-methylcytosine-specific restriction endonuclease McrA
LFPSLHQKYLKFYKVDTSHFRGQAWNKGLTGIGKPRLPLKKILVKNSNFQSYKLKKRLFKAGLKSPQCELCGWKKKAKDGRIPVELDHINGDGKDNRLNNLRILCPNCHSLQSTHRGKNINR